MGATESTNALPFPSEWLPDATAEQIARALDALRAISAIEPDRFLSVRAPLPSLEDTSWELSDFKQHALAAVAADIGLNRLVYKTVPKRVPESEFWRCFFCWAHITVTQVVQTLPPAAAAAAPPPPLSRAVIEAGDSATTTAIISAFAGSAAFKAFAQAEMEDILRRDAEDGDKLAAGIAMAVEKGVLQADPPVEPLTKVDVLGKTADAVAQEIVAALGSAPSAGCVVVLQGLSGTGKGTTVAKLQSVLPRCTSWSNGNVFRALTLLAVTKCELEGLTFGANVLTPPFLAELVGCLSFGKYKGAFDIAIEGHGLSLLVSEVANTILKEPKVGKNIPTVAKMTQGEVVGFAAAAAEAMRADGMNVLMEGREQTLNYVRSPHRFELVLSEPLTIGERRAAQRLMGAALEALQKADAATADVKATLDSALAKLTATS